MTERPTVEPTKTLLTQGYCQACKGEIEVYRYEYESGSLIYQFNHGLCASYYPDELALLDPDLDKAIGRIVAAYNYGHGAGFRALNQEIEVRKVNADLLAALKATEWICDAGLWYCPRCKQQRAKGHMPDCQLAAALAKARN